MTGAVVVLADGRACVGEWEKPGRIIAGRVAIADV